MKFFLRTSAASILAVAGIITLAHSQSFQLTQPNPSARYEYQPYSQYLTPNGPISSNPSAASAASGTEFVGPIQQADPFAQTAIARCGPQENGDYILCEGVGNLISQRQTNFASFLRELYMLAFILAGTTAFIRIVYGGVLYSMSGVVTEKKDAIKIFKSVAWGMALLMGSYVILNTINPALTILALPNVTMGTGPKALPKTGITNPMEPQPYSVTEETISRWEQEERETLSTIELLQDRIQLIETTTPNRTLEQKAELESLRNQLQASENKVKSLQDGIKEGVYTP